MACYFDLLSRKLECEIKPEVFYLKLESLREEVTVVTREVQEIARGTRNKRQAQ